MAEREEPREEPSPKPERREPGEEEAERPDPGRPKRIPPEDSRAREIGKRFMLGDSLSGAPLAVRVTEGAVEAAYAPAELVAKLAHQIALVLRDFGGGIGPMLYAIAPGSSMTLVFGDAGPFGEQEQLAVNRTATHAGRVAELIDLEGDALYARALEIGSPARQYAELTRLVETEGVTLEWSVREEEPRVLTPRRAGNQHARLLKPGETRAREMGVHGVLYRVITEPTVQGYSGSVGIQLHSWSARPPGVRSRKLLANYEARRVEEQIKDGLVGESVEARLSVREPIPGASLELERFRLVVENLKLGPHEDSILGPGLLEDDDEE